MSALIAELHDPWRVKVLGEWVIGNVMLSLVVLKTRQIDALRRFYVLLGIELAPEQHGKGPIHFAGHGGNVVLEIYPLPDNDIPVDSTTRLGFVLENLSVVVEALRAVETPIVTEPQASEWGLRAVVRDPDGRAVELYQR